MAGVLVQVICTPSGGSPTVVIPSQGDDHTVVSDANVLQLTAGTYTIAVQCKLADGTETPLPHSKRRVLIVTRTKK